MNNLIITRCDLSHVHEYNKKLYNTNNHFVKDGRSKPDDYIEKGNLCNTSHWIHGFHSTYHIITLDMKDLFWMKRARAIGTKTGEFPHSYDDELDEICNKYSIPDGNCNEMEHSSILGGINNSWFVRTDLVSLKYGKYGCGPYNNIRNIIISIVTSIETHGCFRDSDIACCIYLMPWITIDPFKEFRIFVYQNAITAISDQNLYMINEWLNTLTDDEIKNILNLILMYFNTHIRDKLIYLSNYVMDLALVNEVPYFIEVNPFGKDYSSGSALFQWEIDHSKLTDSNTIEFRYTAKET